jgi:hypothetical protein
MTPAANVAAKAMTNMGERRSNDWRTMNEIVPEACRARPMASRMRPLVADSVSVCPNHVSI